MSPELQKVYIWRNLAQKYSSWRKVSVIKFRRIITLLLFAFLSSGCTSNFALLNPIGTIATDQKHLLIIATLLMLIIVIPVVFLTLFVAWRYRASNTKATYAPDWSHSTALEIVWWSIPCIIIAILGAITWFSSHDLDPYKPLASKQKPLVIQAIALDWKWLFIYPEKHIASINFLQIPANVPVEFLITADAPMNSLEIPQIAGQIYAIAGMQTRLNVLASKVGDYNGFSANFSGNGFSNMNFVTRVSTQEDFDQWVGMVQTQPNRLTTTAYKQLVQPSENNKVEYFSSPNKDLFATVMMKFMMPVPETEDASVEVKKHA